jgi:sterol desaturase/sphingolipid hydroxylase (fatty acid hydroxylase superfamily)
LIPAHSHQNFGKFAPSPDGKLKFDEVGGSVTLQLEASDHLGVIVEGLARPEMGLVTALFLTFGMSIMSSRRDELGKHASENTSATIVVCGLNVLVAFLFLDEINLFLQSAYAALRIPTVSPALWDDVPVIGAAIFGLAAKDFADYWCHRLMHTRWGWPAHAAHHSDTHVNAFTGYRVHALEALVMSLTYLLLLTWLQIPETIPYVVIFSMLHAQYVHMNLNTNHGPLKYLVAWPQFHRWHHADLPEVYGKNLANLMPLWDCLFGTYHYPGPCPADVPMGARGHAIEDKNPLKIYIYPFQEWRRLIRRELGQRKVANGRNHSVTPRKAE